VVEVEGELNDEGYELFEKISYNEEDFKMSGTVPDPEIYEWRHAPFPVTAFDPINNILYCPDGQLHLMAWRELTPFGAGVWGLSEGTTILFWEVNRATGERVPNTENTPADGGPESIDVWYVHVCVGPSTPSVEAAISGLIPEPRVGLSPEPGFGGITGFETWGWYEQDAAFGPIPDKDDITLTVLDPRWGIPYTVNAHIWAYEYTWDFGDGTPPVVVTRYGTDANLPYSAAATHTYETKGEWPVSLQVTWAGQYTYTGYTGVEVLSPTDRIALADYTVKEVVTRTVANP
jgi:hypothetical protein